MRQKVILHRIPTRQLRHRHILTRSRRRYYRRNLTQLFSKWLSTAAACVVQLRRGFCNDRTQCAPFCPPWMLFCKVVLCVACSSVLLRLADSCHGPRPMITAIYSSSCILSETHQRITKFNITPNKNFLWP